MSGLSVKKKEEMYQKSQLLLPVYSQTPPS